MLITRINYGFWVDRVILINCCSVCVGDADVTEAVCGKGGQCVWEPCAFCLNHIKNNTVARCGGLCL